MKLLDFGIAKVVNPDVRVVRISVNTSAMPEAEALAYLAALETEHGLPAVDPYRQGAGRLVDALE